MVETRPFREDAADARRAMAGIDRDPAVRRRPAITQGRPQRALYRAAYLPAAEYAAAGEQGCWTPPTTARTMTTGANWNRQCGPSTPNQTPG